MRAARAPPAQVHLHDTVKSSVRGTTPFSRAASGTLIEAPEQAEEHLHQIRRIAWNILADVDMILKIIADRQRQPGPALVYSRLDRAAGGLRPRSRRSRSMSSCPHFQNAGDAHAAPADPRGGDERIGACACTDYPISLHCSGASVASLLLPMTAVDLISTQSPAVTIAGIAIMHQRIANGHGTLAIYSAPGQGTTVRGAAVVEGVGSWLCMIEPYLCVWSWPTTT